MVKWTIISLLTSIAVVSAAYDYRHGKIPNFVTIPSAVFGILIHTASNGTDGFLFSASGIAIGLSVLAVPYLLGGVGAGDVKMMGAVGSFLGAKATLEAFFLVAILGGIYSVALIALQRQAFHGIFKQTLITPMLLFSGAIRVQDLAGTSNIESSGRRPRLKYGVPIALGTITYLILKSLGVQAII